MHRARLPSSFPLACARFLRINENPQYFNTATTRLQIKSAEIYNLKFLIKTKALTGIPSKGRQRRTGPALGKGGVSELPPGNSTTRTSSGGPAAQSRHSGAGGHLCKKAGKAMTVALWRGYQR